MLSLNDFDILYFSTGNELKETFIEEAYFHKVYNFFGLGNHLKFLFILKKLAALFLYDEGTQRMPNEKKRLLGDHPNTQLYYMGQGYNFSYPNLFFFTDFKL